MRPDILKLRHGWPRPQHTRHAVRRQSGTAGRTHARPTIACRAMLGQQRRGWARHDHGESRGPRSPSGEPDPSSRTLQEPEVESCEDKDDSYVHRQPCPESVSEEQQIDRDDHGCHHDDVKCRGRLDPHFSPPANGTDPWSPCSPRPSSRALLRCCTCAVRVSRLLRSRGRQADALGGRARKHRRAAPGSGLDQDAERGRCARGGAEPTGRAAGQQGETEKRTDMQEAAHEALPRRGGTDENPVLRCSLTGALARSMHAYRRSSRGTQPHLSSSMKRGPAACPLQAQVRRASSDKRARPPTLPRLGWNDHPHP